MPANAVGWAMSRRVCVPTPAAARNAGQSTPEASAASAAGERRLYVFTGSRFSTCVQ